MTPTDEPRSTRYPVPGSFAEELFSLSEEAFEERFERAYANLEPEHVADDAEVSAEDMNRLEGFVRLHRQIMQGEGEGIAAPDGSFRPVPSGRTFGALRWFDPARMMVLGAHFPPLQSAPSALALGLPLPADADPLERLERIGLPAPSKEPTIIFGELQQREGKTLIYAPAPEGLAELVYRIRRTEEGWDLLLTAERPPEPRFSQLVDSYRRAFSGQGTLRYEDLESVLEREGPTYARPADVERDGGPERLEAETGDEGPSKAFPGA